MTIMIREGVITDAKAICDIYNPYIMNTTISFETKPVSEEAMRERISTNLPLPWLVYEENDKISGYAYACRWRVRSAYRFSVESAVYIDAAHTGRGLGTALYTELIQRLKSMHIHIVIGGVALPNPASIALHEKLGFKKVAHFREVGFKFKQWIDVGYWELVLD